MSRAQIIAAVRAYLATIPPREWPESLARVAVEQPDVEPVHCCQPVPLTRPIRGAW